MAKRAVIFLFLVFLLPANAWCGMLLRNGGRAAPRQASVDHKSGTRAMLKFATSVAAAAAVVFAPHDGQTWAADQPKAPLFYKSGKNPVPPNPPDSKEGTKKDTTFLRCMSNCKSNCQKPGEGLAKLDCLQDCQDQCCK